MTWAQRLKRVFKIDVETCRVCGGIAKVIACIEDPVVIKTILLHIDAQAPKPGESRVTRESRTATGQSVQLIQRNVSVYPYVAAMY